jgi:futalosine hydrolase
MIFQNPGLICAATAPELEGIVSDGDETLEPDRLWRIPAGFAAVTGIGIPSTLIRLLPWLESLRPAWLANTGLAGAYPGSGLKIGELVLGVSECFADLGVETSETETFLPLRDLPFAKTERHLPLELWIPDGIDGGREQAPLRRAAGATVNCCAGSQTTGEMRRRVFHADFESMEGAAVALAGSERGLQVLEVRAISNFAADRDMRPENVSRALEALKAFWNRLFQSNR